MARKKTQTKRERLESLINQACHYAEWNLREHGQVPPSAMALTKDGIFLMSPSKIGTESEKDQFADAARMLAVGYRADAVCMILESWAVFAKTPGQDITNCPPSQSPERVELVAISGEIKGLSAQQFLMIERDVASVFSGFSNPMLPKYEELAKRAICASLSLPGWATSSKARERIRFGISASFWAQGLSPSFLNFMLLTFY